LAGQIALITGAGAGIGAGTAERFAAEGASVSVVDLIMERAQAVAREIGPAAIALRADVTVESDVAAAVNETVRRFGRIDCLVNNAGILGAVGPLTDISLDDWRRTLDVHLTGCFLGMKYVGRQMKAQKSGVILSVASVAGILGGLGPHAYTAAKHAIIGLTKSAASEFAAYGVRVNAVAPGATVSNMTSFLLTGDPQNHDAAAVAMAANSPLGVATLPRDIAEALVFLASEGARHITGQTLAIDAGQTVIVIQPGGFNSRSPELIDVA
jgi:NAD(P)-dependent dehydrogenase (short-subunit alcohol dehydrogenase family)